jgi:ferric-dicitrate binding protein FerR (iron transport regulator)
VFEGAPLEEIVDEFNRYQRFTRLRIEGVPPGTHHYSGAFETNDLQNFADLLSRDRDLIIVKESDEAVIRSRANAE